MAESKAKQKNVGGRPTKLTKAMHKRARDYIENYAEHDQIIPSAAGMSVVLDVAKSTLYTWAEDPETGFSDTLARCNQHQEMKLLNGGLSNKFNSTITKLALHNHGYSDKVDNTLAAPDGGPVQTDSVFEFAPVGADG